MASNQPTYTNEINFLSNNIYTNQLIQQEKSGLITSRLTSTEESLSEDAFIPQDPLNKDPRYKFYLDRFLALLRNVLNKIVAVNLKQVKHLIGLNSKISNDYYVNRYVQFLRELEKNFGEQNNSMDKLLSTFIKRAENTLYQKNVVCDKIFVISKLIKNCFEKSILAKMSPLMILNVNIFIQSLQILKY